MTVAQLNLQRYQQPRWGTLDRVSRNAMIVAAVFGVAVIIAIFVAPKSPPREVTIQEMPERFARLILEKPEPVPTVKKPAPAATYEAPPEVVQATPPKPKPEPVVKSQPKTRPARRTEKPTVAPDKGEQGRAKATSEVAANLTEATGALDKVLGELSQALPAAGVSEETADNPRRRARRGVRRGRARTQLEAVDMVNDVAAADVKGSSLAVETISIAAITDLQATGSAGQPGGTGNAGGGAGEIRSNKTLLAVVRRYAPGIRFCYENELKKSPGLSGKLIVSLTVAVDGQVSNVVLVEDTLHSAAVTDCVLAQMAGWQFPAIEQGVVSFQTPFVFTPPE